MKTLQYMTSMLLVLAGITLLCVPSHAATFTPTRFTVVDEGKVGAPDLVLIPGLTSSREVWAAEAAKLAPNYRLHLVQLAGFAGEPAGPNATGEILPGVLAELHAYCETLPTKPVVIGHSLGGLLTLMLADKYPQDVDRIVIVDALPFIGALFGPTATAEAIQPQAAKMRDGIVAQTPEQRKKSAQGTAASLAIDPDGRKVVERNSEDSDASVMARAMYEDFQTDMRAELPKIKVKTLMLYPCDLALGPNCDGVDALYQGAYKPMPEVKVVRIEQSRHFIMLDQPVKLDELLEPFLANRS